jgi:GntR family transcriptional regulator
VTEWEKIASDLRRKIEAGEFTDGRLPTERDLAEEYEVARPTVQRALVSLTNDGLLEPGQGRRGRRIRRNRPLVFHVLRSESPAAIAEHAAAGVDSWTAAATEQDRAGGQQISVAIEEASASIAAHLGIGQGGEVTVRRRVRTLDGEPHNLATTYYPRSLTGGSAIEGPGDIPQGTIALLGEMGWPQTRSRDEIGTRMPAPAEREQLEVPPGVPVLVHVRVGYSGDTPVKVTVTIWPGDRARLVYEDGDV